MKNRAKRLDNGELVEGSYVFLNYFDHAKKHRINHKIVNENFDVFEIDPATLAMETGIPDKNGNMIYGSVPVEGIGMSKGGDRVRYYGTERFVQQSHPDINPEIDEPVICVFEDEIILHKGAFVCRKEIDDMDESCFFRTLDAMGFASIEAIKETIFWSKDYLTEEEKTCDCNGCEIDESIVGIEITGKQFDNTKNEGV